MAQSPIEGLGESPHRPIRWELRLHHACSKTIMSPWLAPIKGAPVKPASTPSEVLAELILLGSPLRLSDLEQLSRAGIDAASAARALLRRVDSETGGSLVGRNGSGDYAGIPIPYVQPSTNRIRDIGSAVTGRRRNGRTASSSLAANISRRRVAGTCSTSCLGPRRHGWQIAPCPCSSWKARRRLSPRPHSHGSKPVMLRIVHAG